MLAKSVSMRNLSTGRRVRRVGPAEMVELNDESSQIQRERNARILGPGKWSGLGGLVTVTGISAIHVICIGTKRLAAHPDNKAAALRPARSNKSWRSSREESRAGTELICGVVTP